MIKRVLLFGGVGLVVIVLLLIAFSAVALPLFRRMSRPRDLALAKRNGQALAKVHDQTVVAVVAHPDDSEWYIGGTLGMLVRQRNRVVVVDSTSGEKGGDGLNLAKVREGEQEKAARTLGYSRVIFLRNPDRGLLDDEHYREQLRNVFKEEKPAILLAFDAEKPAIGYRHSDHSAAGETALAVAREGSTIQEAYLFSSAASDVLMEISPVLKLKGEAMAAHQSQRKHSSFAGIFFRFFQFLPHSSGEREAIAAGSALSYPEIGIKYAEPFRLVRIAREV